MDKSEFNNIFKRFYRNDEVKEIEGSGVGLYLSRKIGFIFQYYNLISSLNVWENIVLPIGLDGKI